VNVQTLLKKKKVFGLTRREAEPLLIKSQPGDKTYFGSARAVLELLNSDEDLLPRRVDNRSKGPTKTKPHERGRGGNRPKPALYGRNEGAAARRELERGLKKGKVWQPLRAR